MWKEYIDTKQNTDTVLLPYNLQWFAKEGPGGEKTEEPTGKRLKDARNDGKVAKSKEISAAFSLLVLFLVLKFYSGVMGEIFVRLFTYVLGGIDDFVWLNRKEFTQVAFGGLFAEIAKEMLLLVLPFFLFGFVIVLLIDLIQVGWHVTAKPMQPKLSKINPLNGFKRIISKEKLFELLMSIIKVGLIFGIAYTSLKDRANDLFILYELTINQALVLVGELIIDVGIKISAVYMVVGVVDYIYQKHKFHEDMKMTKQEVKDEYKNTEGDPQIKGRIRRKMMEASQRRMMQDVPKADVVITNPTHFAVAIAYEEGGEHKAPVVLAKGEDFLAQKIKEVAKENNVQIVENKPLARMLYHNVDIGAEIPPELYQAVAEILATVFRNRTR